MATKLKAKPKFDARKLMETAVAVMRKSVPEHRPDGSPSPVVGAALVRPDGSIVTAARGEFRGGNHAEFTLLERKCIDENLAGSVLFTTLEPCLDRNEPKRGCARHIVSARISEVYVGIEDDNPTVAGKGIKHLEKNGIVVHLFDPDLQQVILNENKIFFEWARKQTGKPDTKPLQLSKYENPVSAVLLKDLSPTALNQYRARAKIQPAANSQEFLRLLTQQGLISGEGRKSRPTGFGILLFGRQPRNALRQAGVLARAELGPGKSTRQEFDSPMVLVPEQLEAWLNKVLPSTLDRTQMTRREQVDLPFEMIREAVVNALIHRDYDIEGQKCQLVVTPDTITISSPGGPISPITLAQLQSFSAPMKSRNPVLHFIFSRMGMAEEQGYGLTSLKNHAVKLGLPLPSYSMKDGSLTLTIYRSKAAATSTLRKDVLASLSKSELLAWELLATKESVTANEYAEEMRIPRRTALNHLKRFTELGLLEKSGSGPLTRYLLVRR